jgi:hypothetical protein
MPDWTPPRRDPYLDLADEAAHEAAVRARAEERQLRERAAELANWVGTLRDLAERQVGVVLSSRSGRTHRGLLLAVAEDYVALRLPGGQTVAVAGDAVASVRPEPGLVAAPAMGDRERAQDRTLLELIDRAAEERRRVAVGIAGADDVLQGSLAGVGEDVISLRLDSHDRGMVYLRAAAVLEVIVESA